MTVRQDPETVDIQISSEEEGIRLDLLLQKRFSAYSRSYFEHLFAVKRILSDSRAVKKGEKGVAGQTLSITFTPLPPTTTVAQELPLNILFEDEALVVINKDPLIVTHPAPGHYTGTVANALVYHCQETLDIASFPSLRPGIVHRLDKETSGVLVTTKNPLAHKMIGDQFANRFVKKKYLALCYGIPPEGIVSAPISRDPKHRTKMCISNTGKEAISIFRVIQTWGPISLVEIDLKTGRTHQIRVHLRHLGIFLLGDRTYGDPQINQKYQVSRHLLHCHEIKLSHPISGKPLSFQAPLPEDMKNFIALIQHS